jgi:hypothetical protein
LAQGDVLSGSQKERRDKISWTFKRFETDLA